MNPAIDPAIASRLSTPTEHRLSSKDGGLSVVFSWQTDRYAHVIDRDANGAEPSANRQLISIEGTPHDDWPSSAAISQLSTENIDGRPTILGVGCSGTSHFSVSVQLDEPSDGGPTIRFDWAARLAKPLGIESIAKLHSRVHQSKSPLAWLGSTYRLPACGQDDWVIDTIVGTFMNRGDGDGDQPLSLQPTHMKEIRTVTWSYQIKIKESCRERDLD